jgi:hypothetical protein
MKENNMNFYVAFIAFKKRYVYYPKNSPETEISVCKWNFGNTDSHCSNSAKRELCVISCTSNERREAKLCIHIYLIKQIIYYDIIFLQRNPVSFYLGHAVEYVILYVCNFFKFHPIK